MKNEYWHEKWQENKIGFNQKNINTQLQKYYYLLKTNQNIVVPLCGKSIDMVFLSSKFKKVFGAELSEIACDDFFTENNISFTKENNIYISNKIELHSGDYIKSFLAIKKHKIHAFYDRASLIALPKNMREEYVKNQSEILQPNSKGLLITLEYEQENTSQRPPFSIQKPEIDMLYGKYFSVEKLETIPANSPYKNSYESAYILTKKFS